ncbi:acyl-CoA thioesterase [Marinomonas agarivorans]|nr:acyl-CoA thioesterase [Marinomonas agarivorans]
MGHKVEFEVRDYECDLQGIVNNAVYQNYIEHARHKFLLDKGLDFAQLTKDGIYLVVTRIEMDFKRSLVSGDQFVVVTSACRQSRFKFDFFQEIRRMTDDQLMVKAKVTGASISPNGRPIELNDLEKLFSA